MNKKNRLTAHRPIENHKTAAWADIENEIPESKVSIPSERAVREAKEWVDDSNQK